MNLSLKNESDIFFLLPLGKVIKLMKMIFSVKQLQQHKNMEDISNKVSCEWDQPPWRKFQMSHPRPRSNDQVSGNKENLWGRLLERVVLCSEHDPHRFLPTGEQRVKDCPAAPLSSGVRVTRTVRELLVCVPRRGTYWAAVYLMTHKTKAWERDWLKWSLSKEEGATSKSVPSFPKSDQRPLNLRAQL